MGRRSSCPRQATKIICDTTLPSEAPQGLVDDGKARRIFRAEEQNSRLQGRCAMSLISKLALILIVAAMVASAAGPGWSTPFCQTGICSTDPLVGASTI